MAPPLGGAAWSTAETTSDAVATAVIWDMIDFRVGMRSSVATRPAATAFKILNSVAHRLNVQLSDINHGAKRVAPIYRVIAWRAQFEPSQRITITKGRRWRSNCWVRWR
jgi:hypothetical protein